MQEVTTELAKLITSLREVAPELWRVTMRQAVLESYAALAWGLLFLAITTTLVIMIIRKRSLIVEIWEDNSPSGILIMIGSVVLVISALLSAGNLLNAYYWLLNPEYHAIQLLLGHLK